MSSLERSLTVLGCKQVDDVLLDAPPQISRDMVDTLGIQIIVHVKGCLSATDEAVRVTRVVELSMGVDVFDNEALIKRVQAHDEDYQRRYKAKKRSEEEYHRDKYK